MPRYLEIKSKRIVQNELPATCSRCNWKLKPVTLYKYNAAGADKRLCETVYCKNCKTIYITKQDDTMISKLNLDDKTREALHD